MPILGFLSVLKKIAPVNRYAQDPSQGEDLDCTEGVLALYADKYVYSPKKVSPSKKDGQRIEQAQAVMRTREVDYRSVVGLETQLLGEKTLCLAVKLQKGETDFFTGSAVQMQPAADILRSYMKTVTPQLVAVQQVSPEQSSADSPNGRRIGTMAGLKIPLINVGAQEKLCKFCDTSYPVKALYCPNCGAFETRKAAFGKK